MTMEIIGVDAAHIKLRKYKGFILYQLFIKETSAKKLYQFALAPVKTKTIMLGSLFEV